MILRLDLPPVPKAVGSLRVRRWLVKEGDTVALGDVIVELTIETWLKRMFKEQPGEPRPPRVEGDVAELDLISRMGGDVVEVVASDGATVRAIVAGEGADVRPGGLLAVLSTEPGEAVPAGAAEGALAFRAVADVIDDEEDGED